MKSLYTTYEVAKICYVDMTTAIKWIKDGKLEAYKTPGGHRRIKRDDILVFLKKYNMPIPEELTGADKKRVLVIDDDKEVVEVISRFLKRKGYVTQSAFTGFESGRKVEKFSPGIVLLDIKLPGINGIEICKNIKKKNENIKVVVMTGYPTKENKRKMFRARASEFLTKPIDLKILEKAIMR